MVVVAQPGDGVRTLVEDRLLKGGALTKGTRVMPNAPQIPKVVEQVPGAMIRLGTGVPGSDTKVDIHQSAFDVDERAIGYGVRVMVHTALAALSAGAF